MATTPLQPRQTAWGRACVVDTAYTITPGTGRCQAAAPTASRNTVTIRPYGGSGYRDPGLAWSDSRPLPRSSRAKLRDTLPDRRFPSFPFPRRRDWTSMPQPAGRPEIDLEVAALKERYA